MPNDNGTGRQNPLTRMMVDSFDNLMRQCMFCLPGRITTFDPETQLAQVECGIQRLRDGKGHTIPVIESVPVCFPGDNDWYFFHQITPGETEGLIHFSQRAIDTWIDQGGPVAPHEARMLTEDDAFFVPGVRSRPNVIPGFKNDGAGVSNYAQDTYAHFKEDGTVEVASAGDTTVDAGGAIKATAGTNITADAPNGQADVTAPTINLTGSVNIVGSLSLQGPLTSSAGSDGEGASITGDVEADGISLKKHTHTQPSDAAGDSESPTDAPT